MHQRAPGAGTSTAVWWARLSGVVAGLAGLAVADLAAWLIAPTASPLTAVGELIISLLPAPLINFGKDSLGTADKPILLAIIAVVVLLVAGLAGQLELRRRFAGVTVFALLTVLALVGVAARIGASPSGYVPTLVGLLLGYVVLTTLVGKLRDWLPRRGRAGDEAALPARRSFLRSTAVVGVLAAAGAITGRVLAGAANAVSTARSKVALPLPTKAAPPVPAGADFGVPDLSPYVTPNDDFYRIDTALQVPVIDPASWSLKVTGMVEQEITLDYATLSALPLVEHLTTLTCVSNDVGGDLIGNARWLGYPVRELLARAKPKPGADMVLSSSDDGFSAGTPLSALTDPDRQALLAIGMNGEPLPLEHGFPVRVVVPGLYGYVSATKWVTELKVTTFANDQGYWTPLGWSAMGPIKTASRIDVPRRSTVDAGTVTVAGVAWDQHTGITKVEVQVDQGDWQPAELAATSGPDTWRQWRYAWAAQPGSHSLAVRATNANGELQTAAEAAPAPNGASGYHRISVKVR